MLLLILAKIYSAPRCVYDMSVRSEVMHRLGAQCVSRLSISMQGAHAPVVGMTNTWLSFSGKKLIFDNHKEKNCIFCFILYVDLKKALE